MQADGAPVRQLLEGEYVQRAGHHVVWLPGPAEEIALIHRILAMLETMPASRVAAQLTAEGVPTPDAGRSRTDRGVKHPTSGVWHQPTLVGIARNPLLRAAVEYGRRSMGDQLRFSGQGPRELEEADRHADGKPKVIANPPSVRIQAPRISSPWSSRIVISGCWPSWTSGPGPSAANRGRRTRRAIRWAARFLTWAAAGPCIASRI